MLRATTAPSATPWPLPSPFLFVLDCHPSLPALSLCPSALPRQALSLLAHSKHRQHFMENHCNGCAAHRITVHSLTQNLPSVCSHRVWEGEFKQWGVLRGGGKIPLNSHFKAEIADLREKGDLKKKKRCTQGCRKRASALRNMSVRAGLRSFHFLLTSL